MKTWYRRNLPHWVPEEAVFFITFRLADSLPAWVLDTRARERRIDERMEPDVSQPFDEGYFAHFDRWLDKCLDSSPKWLREPEVARIVAREIHRMDNERYRLIAYCIMPNHVHLLLHTVGYGIEASHRGPTRRYPLADTLRLLKGRTARFCNELLSRTGAFWQHESYDHVVRDKREFDRILAYILDNPVKAGLVDEWWQWPFSWVVPEGDS